MAETTTSQQKPGLSTFVMVFAFGLVFLVMFDAGLRETVGDVLGAILNPLIGFGGRHYAWTIFFAGVILIVLTTVIRHFLVDWIAMARMQEGMRSYQKELSEARKSNNTYKLKKLMDKQPELLQLQGEMSKSQLKPMVFTMLIVIPIFAWLSTIMYAPVAYSLTHDEGAAGVFYFDTDLNSADLVAPDDPAVLTVLHAGRFVPFALPGGSPDAPVILHDPRYDDPAAAIPPAEWLAIDWEGNRLATLPAGQHVIRVAEGGDAPRVAWPIDDEEVHASTNTLVVLLPQAGGAEPIVLVATDDPKTVTVPEGGAVLYAVIPVPMEAAEGSTLLLVDPDGPSEREFQVETLVPIGGAGAHETPHGMEVPWNLDWDLLESFILPRWILLYSLFTIPFGQVTQKALKLWEYRHAVEAHQL